MIDICLSGCLCVVDFLSDRYSSYSFLSDSTDLWRDRNLYNFAHKICVPMQKKLCNNLKKKFDFKIFGEFLKFYIWTSRQPTGPSSFFVLSKARYTLATKSAVLATLSTATSCRIQVVADLSPVSATVDFVASVYRALVLV